MTVIYDMRGDLLVEFGLRERGTGMLVCIAQRPGVVEAGDPQQQAYIQNRECVGMSKE